jgi:hypothetical protein
MRRKHSDGATDSIHAARVAWWASFFATVALIAVLGLARSAQAITVPTFSGVTATATAPPSAGEDLEGEEEAEAESEDEELEAEECEEEEECEGEDDPEVPAECVLSSAQATVFASGAQDKVRLIVRYASSSPTVVAVDFGLHGSKGSLYLGESRKRFSKAGVFRETASLSEPQMAKVIGARDFTVQLYALGAPHYCRHSLDRHLTLRSAAPSGLTWSDPESSFRPKHKP